MIKPLAFMCETDKCLLSRETEYIMITFSNKEGVHIQFKSKDMGTHLNNITDIVYDIERDIYIFRDNDKNVMTINTIMSFLYISEVLDNLNTFIVSTKSYSDSEEYPIFKTEIENGMCITYCTPAALVDQFTLLQTPYKPGCVEEHEKITRKMTNIIHEIYSDYYSGDDTTYYIYHKHMIYKVNNVGVNVLYVQTVDVYNQDKDIEYLVIPYFDLNDAFLFTDKDMFIYEGKVIVDGCVSNMSLHNLAPIVFSSDDNELFNDALIFSITRGIDTINHMLDLLQDGNELENMKIIDGIKSMRDTMYKDMNELSFDFPPFNSIRSIIMPCYGKYHVFNYEFIMDYISELDKVIASYEIASSDVTDND